MMLKAYNQRQPNFINRNSLSDTFPPVQLFNTNLDINVGDVIVTRLNDFSGRPYFTYWAVSRVDSVNSRRWRSYYNSVANPKMKIALAHMLLTSREELNVKLTFMQKLKLHLINLGILSWVNLQD